MPELLFKYSPLPMAAVEGDGHIVRYINPAFCRLIGKKCEEIAGIHFAQAVPEAEVCLPALDRVYSTGKPEECEASWSYAMWAIPGGGGRQAGVVVLVTDKTGDARFREQAAAMNQELMLSAVQQHELMETSENLNARLQAEIPKAQEEREYRA